MQRLSKITARLSVLALFLLAGLLWPFKDANACCTCMSVTEPNSYREWFATGYTVDDITNTYDWSMTNHEQWIINTMFYRNILPAMQLMAEQLSATMVQQTEILGALFDAKQQLENQRSLQKIQAEAHRDYHTSNGLCEFGSAVRSLSASESRGELTAVALAQRSIDRHLGTAGTSARAGPAHDVETRLGAFRNVYCDPRDNNNILSELCTAPGSNERYNRDVNYSAVLDSPLTLNVNFTDPTLKRDEQDVFALAANLYGSEVFTRPMPGHLNGSTNDQGFSPIIRDYMDVRSITAKRNVAENSFNALVGMKAESPDSTAGSKKYLNEMIKELGVPDADVEKLLGKNPSYYAQMEVLTRKIYENPLFYTNLYDKTANVARKDVALKAIGLMQKFDTFKSALRTEANLSVLLELGVMEAESDITNTMADIVTEGEIPTP